MKMGSGVALGLQPLQMSHRPLCRTVQLGQHPLNQFRKAAGLADKTGHRIWFNLLRMLFQMGLNLPEQGFWRGGDGYQLIRRCRTMFDRAATVRLDHRDTPRQCLADGKAKGFFPLRHEQQHIYLSIKVIHRLLIKAGMD